MSRAKNWRGCLPEMRLAPDEIAALRQALSNCQWQHVWLFGSRLDEKRQGGDIDLLVHSKQPAFALAHEIASRYAAAVDGKLDVLVVDPDRVSEEQRCFINTLTLEPLDDLVRT
jgi:predicted nucleotidyltransferase